jgi:hypothetical protein
VVGSRVVEHDRQFAEPPLLVGHRPAEQGLDVVLADRGELEDLAPADQRAVDAEERVLCRRPDQQHVPGLHVRQQDVLLGAVEPVDLVEEQHRPPAVVPEPLFGRVKNRPHLLHPDGGRVHLLELALGVVGYQRRERGLPGPRRAVEDDGRQPVGLQHPPEQLAGGEEVLLADELVQRPRPHPDGERGDAVEIPLADVGEQVHLAPGLYPTARRTAGSPKARGL